MPVPPGRVEPPECVARPGRVEPPGGHVEPPGPVKPHVVPALFRGPAVHAPPAQYEMTGEYIDVLCEPDAETTTWRGLADAEATKRRKLVEKAAIKPKAMPKQERDYNSEPEYKPEPE